MSEQIITFSSQWLDLIWVIIVLFTFKGRDRIRAIIFILTCMLMLRLQVDFMIAGDFEYGALPWLKSHVLTRGYIVYGVFISFFLGLAYFSKDTNNYVYMAASIGILVTSCVSSTLIMLL